MPEHKAHRCGIRIRRVCARNTSKLAYDDSGSVTRDSDNYSMCTFKTGEALFVRSVTFVQYRISLLPAGVREVHSCNGMATQSGKSSGVCP